MWDVDDAVTNGACAKPKLKLPPVNGAQECGHNSISDAAANTGCCMSNANDSHPACRAVAEHASEKHGLLKCFVYNSGSSEVSGMSVMQGTASVHAASAVDMQSTASFANSHSVTRTSRHLYSDSLSDSSGYYLTNSGKNYLATTNGSAYDARAIGSDEYICTNDVDRCSLQQSPIVESVHSEDINHNSAQRACDGGCSVVEEMVEGEAGNSNVTRTDFGETSVDVPELFDDGYMDEIDIPGLTAVNVHTCSHSTAWFVDTDSCLDDFIDADIPHNAAVPDSPSSSSLSSTHGELTGMGMPYTEDASRNPADRAADSVNGALEHDVSVGRLQESLQHSSKVEYSSASWDCLQPSLLLNGSGVCSRSSEAETVKARSSCTVNMQLPISNSSDSMHDASPPSLPSPSDEFYSHAELVAAGLPSSTADDQVFDDCISRGLTAGECSSLDASGVCDGPAGSKHSHCYWLPIGPDSDLPKFGCWSCIEVMNSSSADMSAGYMGSGRCGLSSNATDCGVMWRSATDHESRSHYSNLLSDDGDSSLESLLSARMSSSLTFEDLRDDSVRERSRYRARHMLHSSGSMSGGNSVRTKDKHVLESDQMAAECSPGLDPLVCSLDSVVSSSCSTVAVVSVLKRLGIAGKHREVGSLMHRTHYNDKLQLCDYLLACSRAGTTVSDIIKGLAAVTEQKVFGKFFSLKPKSNVRLSQWLDSWIIMGAVPLLTLKLSDESADDNVTYSWRHLLVHQVCSEGIVVGDSPCIVTEDALRERLLCEPTVEVRRADVVSRWRDTCDLSVLIFERDEDWHEINVLGQVVNMLREEKMAKVATSYRLHLTSHITLPSHHRPGVTLFVPNPSPAFDKLQQHSSTLPAVV